jgi:hypothetical protein
MAQTYSVRKPEGIYHRGIFYKAGSTFEGEQVPSYFVKLGYLQEVKSVDVRAQKRAKGKAKK